MFGCSSTSSLPQNDPDLSNFQCGSDQLNSYSYASAGLVLCLMVICLAIFFSISSNYVSGLHALFSNMAQYLMWHRDYVSGDMNIDKLAHILSIYRYIFSSITCIIVIVFLPIYLILKYESYSTHTYVYGWVVSLGFMHDSTPAIVCMVMFALTNIIYIRKNF